MWAKRGQQPVVKSAPTQQKVAMIGFVNPTNGVLRIFECTKFNYETIMNSVKQFLSNTCNGNKKLLIVLDNASWHKKAVRLMRDDLSYATAEFLFLPPYSPDLNPIERVWRITRKERTHNRYFDEVFILRDTLIKYFEQFIEPNLKLFTLCSNYNNL